MLLLEKSALNNLGIFSQQVTPKTLEDFDETVKLELQTYFLVP
jgi:hypothetical protein